MFQKQLFAMLTYPISKFNARVQITARWIFKTKAFVFRESAFPDFSFDPKLISGGKYKDRSASIRAETDF